MGRAAVAGGVGILAFAWSGPLPELAEKSFSAHMVLHVMAVAVAPPVIALGVAGTRFDPFRRRSRFFAPLPASAFEFLTVWLWHTPAAHHAALGGDWMFALEQGSYLFAGMWVWMAAFGRPGDPARQAAGVATLLFTSMHMTLLGVLLATSPRILYAHRFDAGLAPLQDQQVGGVIMLAGGASYLAGGMFLLATLLRHPPPRRNR